MTSQVNTFPCITSVHIKKQHHMYPRNSFEPWPVPKITFILISNTLDYFLVFL